MQFLFCFVFVLFICLSQAAPIKTSFLVVQSLICYVETDYLSLWSSVLLIEKKGVRRKMKLMVIKTKIDKAFYYKQITFHMPYPVESENVHIIISE